MKKVLWFFCALLIKTSSLSAQERKKLDFEGFTEKADRYVKSIENIGEFRGTILVAKGNEIKFHKGYGMASERFEIPNSENTKFRVGSVTKSFTAISILQLIEKGKLSLEDPVSKFLPKYSFADKIKIKHLLSHTSGIKRDIKFPEQNKEYPLKELIKLSEVDSLLYKPGSKMTYSNCGYILLQYILEKQSGSKYEDYVTKNVLNPLGLFNTGIEHPKTPPKRLADGFGSGVDKNGHYAIVETPMLAHGYPIGVGAMYSTTEDLMKFSRQIGKSKILSKESWDLALKPFIKNKGYEWGFGFNIIKSKTFTAFNHNGRTTGFRCGYFYFKEDDLTIIILGNYNNASREEIVKAFRRILLKIKYKQPEPLVAKVTTSRELKEYLGDYKTEGFPFKILEFENNIYVQSHGDAPVIIKKYDNDAFFCKYFDLRLKFKREEGKIIGCDWNFKETTMPARKI